MAIRKINPTTPGQRGMTVSAFDEITRTTPEKSLTTDLRGKGGRKFTVSIPPVAPYYRSYCQSSRLIRADD